MDPYMFKEDDSYTKQQYLDEFGLEQILDDYNAKILKHDCNPICEKKIVLIEKRNKVFRLLRDELKEVDPGCLITSVNDRVGHLIRPNKRTGLLPKISNFFTVSFKRFIRK
tara:strand:- start:50 stop:382 length:333 start_codon:yes stop_codon:yes gene_type:complete